MEVFNLIKIKNLREVFLKNIVDEIIEIIDSLGPHKVMLPHLSFIRKMEKRTQADHWLRRTYLSAQLGPAISRLVLHTRAIVEERLVYNNTWINKKPKVQHSHARKWQSTYNINNKIVKPSSVSLYNKNISTLRTSIQAKKLIKEDWLKQWQKISSLAPKYHKYHTNRTMIQQAYHGHGIQSSEHLSINQSIQ